MKIRETFTIGQYERLIPCYGHFYERFSGGLDIFTCLCIANNSLADLENSQLSHFFYNGSCIMMIIVPQ